jgi:hypothetical protein
MLPDYPELKHTIVKKLLLEMQNEMTEAAGFIGAIQRSIIFEGDKCIG